MLVTNKKRQPESTQRGGLPRSHGVLLLDANHLDRNPVAGDGNLENESTVEWGLFGLPFTINDQPIASGGKARQCESDRVGGGCMVFKREADTFT